MSKKDSRYFKVKIEYDGPIKAPIKKDQKIGKLKLFKKDELLKSVDVFSFENVDKINIFKSVFTSINYMIWGDV